MHWIAPSEKDNGTATLEKRLWDAAGQFCANSGLKSQEYSAPVLGLIFLRFAEVRFAAQRAKLEKASASARRGSRLDEPAAYHADGILYLPAEARFDYLLNRPEAESIGAKVNAAMRDIEKHNPQLAGVLPKTYTSNRLPKPFPRTTPHPLAPTASGSRTRQKLPCQPDGGPTIVGQWSSPPQTGQNRMLAWVGCQWHGNRPLAKIRPPAGRRGSTEHPHLFSRNSEIVPTEKCRPSRPVAIQVQSRPLTEHASRT